MNTIALKDSQEARGMVRQNYGKVASGQQTGCCGKDRPSATRADQLGYSPEEIAALPSGADLGLGCGNPPAIASLKPGETVLDLGLLRYRATSARLLDAAGCGVPKLDCAYGRRRAKLNGVIVWHWQ